MKWIILLLLVVVGCGPTIKSILVSNPDLAHFMAQHQNYILEQEMVSSDQLALLQQRTDGLGSWYRQVPSRSYLQVKLRTNDDNGFLVLINREDNHIEQILGLVHITI